MKFHQSNSAKLSSKGIFLLMLFFGSILLVNAQIFLSNDTQITEKEQIYSKDSITNKVEKKVEIHVAKNSTFIIKKGTKVSDFFLTENTNDENKTIVVKNCLSKNSKPVSSTSKKKLLKKEVKTTQFISNPFEESNSSLVLLNINGKGSVVVPISNYKGKTILKNINELFIFVKIGHKETNFSFLVNYRASSLYNRHTLRPPPTNFS